jgi:phosphatidylinositol alpha-1,6-mannosyltransferase
LARSNSIVDLSNSGGRRQQLSYLLGLRGRIRREAASVDGIDSSDASLAGMVTGQGVPCWARVHGLDFMARHPGYRTYLRRYVPRLDAVVTNSIGTQEQFCKQFKFPIERAPVIHPIPYLQKLARSPSATPTAVFVGRLVARKGVVEFVDRVWPLILEQSPTAQFVIIGDGPQRARLLRAIRKKGLSRSVKFLGGVGEEEKRRVLATANVGIMYNQSVPGDWEGFGMVAAENALIGLPTVGTDLEGLRDSIVDGLTGTRVPPNDPQRFASTVVQHLHDPNLDSRRMSEEAELRWGPGRFARQYLAFVEKMVA